MNLLIPDVLSTRDIDLAQYIWVDFYNKTRTVFGLWYKRNKVHTKLVVDQRQHPYGFTLKILLFFSSCRLRVLDAHRKAKHNLVLPLFQST